jgi:hypothetical protein
MGYKREREREKDSRKGINKENDETLCTMLVDNSVFYASLELGVCIESKPYSLELSCSYAYIE